MSTVPQTYYVYILTRPDKKLPQGRAFYVGKGKRRRIYAHEAEARSGCECRKCRTIRKVWRDGGQVQRYIIFTTNNETEAFDFERETIAQYGRKNLCNLTDGGEGTSGAIASPEKRAKMSASAKVRSTDPGYRAKVSADQKARWTDPAYRANFIAAQKAQMDDPGHRAKLSASRIALWEDPAYRAKLSAAHTAQMADPEKRAQVSATLKAYFAAPEEREKLRLATTAQWADPEFRSKLIAKRNEPDYRAKQSANMKAVWARRKASKGEDTP
jgi:hypothetical protein